VRMGNALSDRETFLATQKFFPVVKACRTYRSASLDTANISFEPITIFHGPLSIFVLLRTIGNESRGRSAANNERNIENPQIEIIITDNEILFMIGRTIVIPLRSVCSKNYHFPFIFNEITVNDPLKSV